MNDTQELKRCCKCREDKVLDLFPKCNNRPDGRQAYCRECRKLYPDYGRGTIRRKVSTLAKNFRYRYGISIPEEDLLRVVAQQVSGACEVCGVSAHQEGLCLDHNHVTGVIRGVICRNCNLVLGHAFDSTTLLEAALAYLQRHTNEGDHRDPQYAALTPDSGASIATPEKSQE